MPVPRDWTLDLAAFAIPEDMVYPCFVKPLASISGYKTEMKACRNEKELAAHLVLLRSHNQNRSIFIQEFLEIEEEISLSGVCIDQEIILPGLVKKSHVAKYEKGVTLAGSLIPPDALGKDVEEQIKEVLRKFHYVGMFDMEILLCKGVYYFGEVNLRSGGPNFAYTLNGTNLPEVAARAIAGEARVPEKEQLDRFYRPFLYEKVAWEDYMNLCMTKEELLELLGSIEDRLLAWDQDPGPGDYFSLLMEQTGEVRRQEAETRQKKERLKEMGIFAPYRAFREGQARRRDFNSYMSPDRKIAVQDVLAGRCLRPTCAKRVILLSRNYCSLLSLIRQLAGQGYRIDVVRIFQTKPAYRSFIRRMNPEAYSKYVDRYSVCITERKPERLLNFVLDMYDPDLPTLLLPLDDLPTSVLDQNYDLLKDKFLLPNIAEKPGSINRAMEKNFQKLEAPKFGLNVAGCHEVWITNHTYALPAGIGYPCFIKPLISVTSSKAIMQRCDSEAALKQALNALAVRQSRLGILVEDYLKIEEEYALVGLCADDKVLIPDGMFHFLKNGMGRHIGVAMQGEVISTEPMAELIDQLRCFLKSLHFTGLFDVDLLQADGKIYFCELNLRYGASGAALAACGVNLPALLADHMLNGAPLPEEAHIDRPGRTYASEKILFEAYAEGFLKQHEMLRLMKRSDINFIRDPEDPEPYKYFKTMYKYVRILPLYQKLKAIRHGGQRNKKRRRKRTPAEGSVLVTIQESLLTSAEKGYTDNDPAVLREHFRKAEAELLEKLDDPTLSTVARQKLAGQTLITLIDLLQASKIDANASLIMAGHIFAEKLLDLDQAESQSNEMALRRLSEGMVDDDDTEEESDE